ncbi:PD-(D/E)XK nuclease family protein [Candidatus Saccharibacteria bacterium]|nr:PD-(D/E)XK nuclease family protein [Candidatus Saccharibacteria bacterium]
MGYWQERNQPYRPGQSVPFKVSRSKIELFMQCERCFWLDVRLKIKRPSGPPFNINKAIDELFKKEFDKYRNDKKPHPLMVEFGVDAIPFEHDQLDTWRETFVGIVSIHKPTNLHVFGGVDDIWVGGDGKLIVVDYKATAKDSDVGIDSAWQISYKRQLEVYQWLLRQNGFDVSDTGYFVYTNGRMDLDGFGDRLEFRTKIIAYKGSDDWIEPVLIKMKQCMDADIVPAVGQAAMGGECDFCSYARSRTELTLKALETRGKSKV